MLLVQQAETCIKYSAPLEERREMFEGTDTEISK